METANHVDIDFDPDPAIYSHWDNYDEELNLKKRSNTIRSLLLIIEGAFFLSHMNNMKINGHGYLTLVILFLKDEYRRDKNVCIKN